MEAADLAFYAGTAIIVYSLWGLRSAGVALVTAALAMAILAGGDN